MRCPSCARRLRPGRPCPLHGGGADGFPAAEVPPPPTIDGWERGELLGAGGFGQVYAARGARHDRAVLKISLRLADARLEREAALLARLPPGLAPALLDQGTTAAGVRWLALEWIDGPTVAAYLADLPGGGAAPRDDLRAIVGALGAAIARLHAAGVVHRDLKPENVILRDGDPARVTLLDFGLALDADERHARPPGGEPSLTLRGQRLGTLPYTAPEQLGDARAAGRPADVYALAAMAFELLTGRPPFVGQAGDIEQGHLLRRPPAASSLAPVATAVDHALARGLAKVPELRPPPAQLVAELLRALDVVAAPAPQASPIAAADEAARPVALLGLYPRGGPSAIASAVAGRRGRIARINGDRAVVAFVNADSPAAGVRAALQTAAALGLGAVVHIAMVEIQHEGRERLTSDELDRPAWLVPRDVLGDRVLVTEAAAAELPESPRAELEGYVVPSSVAGPAAPAPTRLPIAGRKLVVDAIVAEARTTVTTGTPGWCTLIGEPGLGKTRALAAIAAALAPVMPALVLAADAATPLVSQLAEAAGVVEPVAIAAVASPAERLLRAEQLAAGLRRRAAGRGLALLVDDAHAADALSLDALELASLAGDDDDEAPVPLLVCVAARPVLLELRPELGARATRDARHRLGPLDRRTSRGVLRRLLRPAERVPVTTLDAIAEIAGGVPSHLVDIVQALRTLGAVRRKPGGAWYLASEDLLHVSSTPLADQLAERFLARTPASLRPFVHAVAAFGDDGVISEQLEAIRAAAERDGIDLGLGDLDVGVALARLRSIGVVRDTRHGRIAVRDPLLRQALDGRMAVQPRRALHALAFRLDEDRDDPGGAERRARHAAAAGFAAEAGRAYLAAGRAAVARHEHARAEQWFGAALEHAEPASATAQAAWLARGSTRIRLERWTGALTDLEQAAAVAAADDHRALAECLLEQATVLDWTYRWKESAERAEEAAPHVDRAGSVGLEARLALARGRSAFRADRFVAAADELERAAALAATAGEAETHTVALLLLAVSLTLDGRADDATRRFDEVMARCERTGDLHHLAVAHSNRIILWETLGDADAALADARRTQTLARRLGLTTLESTASHNLAHLLYFRGELPQALALATRGRDLYHRNAELPGPEHDVLIARIRGELGDVEAVHAALATLRERYAADAWSESAAIAVAALAIRHPAPGTARDDPGDAPWRELLARADGFRASMPDELIDLRRLAAEAALAGGRTDDARAHVAAARDLRGADAAHWRRRLDELEARVESAGTGAPRPRGTVVAG